MQRLSVASRTRNDITYASSSRKGLQNISPISSLVHQKQAVFRRSYGVLVQCAGAGTALSPTYNMSKNSTPVRMIHAGQRVARRNREPSCSRSSAAWMNSVAARRSISATSSTSQSFVNSASTSTLENNCTNPRIIHLMMASMLAAVTTVGWAFNWYDNSSSSTAATPTSETSSNFSFSSRRTGSTASNSSVPGGIPNKTTKRPYDISIRAIRGGRFTMEDEYFVGNGGRFAAVFDGHGGSGVSSFLKRRLFSVVNEFLQQKHWEVDGVEIHNNDRKTHPNGNDGPTNDVVKTIQDDQQLLKEYGRMPSVASHVAALRAGFEKMEQDVIENDALAHQGSTAVAVILHESDDGTRTLLSANVGDSRAILSRKGKAVELTRDHKPNDEREKRRILAMGETIEWDAECMVHRVRNLSLARAIGDRYAKPAVSPEVEIQHFPVSEEDDEFIVLASDGLWDVMTSQDVVSFVNNYIENEVSRMRKDNAANYRLVLRKNMAKLLAREAIRKGSTDNICVLMIWL